MSRLTLPRRGVALAELIVAFALAALVSAAAAAAMLGAERYVRRAGVMSEDRRAVHEADCTPLGWSAEEGASSAGRPLSSDKVDLRLARPLASTA